jgi:hypothetical protein
VLRHVPLYREIFALPGFLADPVLIFGVQDVRIPELHFAQKPPLPWRRRLERIRHLLRFRWEILRGRVAPCGTVPDEYRAADLSGILHNLGAREIHSLDLFDDRADLRYDMNQPVPDDALERYGTLIDIGSLEHLFDTAQCLENCLRMVRPDGHYLLHTPVKGYLGHGLHTFNPDGLVDAFTENGFEVVFRRFTSKSGHVLEDVGGAADVLLWLVGRKVESLKTFQPPQQKVWSGYYARS